MSRETVCGQNGLTIAPSTGPTIEHRVGIQGVDASRPNWPLRPAPHARREWRRQRRSRSIPDERATGTTTRTELRRCSRQGSWLRALTGTRGLPQRVAGTVRGRGTTSTLEASRRTFRFRDMVDLGWFSLGETPGVELVLGQVGRPWKGVAVSADVPTTPEQFSSFGEPGFAKIATSLRAIPTATTPRS